MLAFRDVAGESAKACGLVEFVFDWRDDEIEPPILTGRGARYKLVPELMCFLRPPETGREPVAFGNDA